MSGHTTGNNKEKKKKPGAGEWKEGNLEAIILNFAERQSGVEKMCEAIEVTMETIEVSKSYYTGDDFPETQSFLSFGLDHQAGGIISLFWQLVWRGKDFVYE